MRHALVVSGILALAVAGCSVGGNLERVASSYTPRGASAALYVRNDTPRRIELLTANDSGLVVLHQERVKSVRFEHVRQLRIDGLDQYREPFEADEIAAIRRVSRFPYGISDDVMRALLAASGQTEPDVLD